MSNSKGARFALLLALKALLHASATRVDAGEVLAVVTDGKARMVRAAVEAANATTKELEGSYEYAVGGDADVWSDSYRGWCKGNVTSKTFNSVTVQYYVAFRVDREGLPVIKFERKAKIVPIHRKDYLAPAGTHRDSRDGRTQEAAQATPVEISQAGATPENPFHQGEAVLWYSKSKGGWFSGEVDLVAGDRVFINFTISESTFGTRMFHYSSADVIRVAGEPSSRNAFQKGNEVEVRPLGDGSRERCNDPWFRGVVEFSSGEWVFVTYEASDSTAKSLLVRCHSLDIRKVEKKEL